MGTGEFNAGGNPAMDWHPIQGGVEIFLVASCHGNRDKLRPGGPLGSYADFTSLLCPITVTVCHKAAAPTCHLVSRSPTYNPPPFRWRVDFNPLRILFFPFKKYLYIN